ncbi:hypothetical protein CF327_g1068 [Tilletia walkeri]|nr:hypothetical protein CF327_g1068 [Tilletia walkeri]
MEAVLAIKDLLNLDLNINLDVLNAHTMMDSRAGGSTTTTTSTISQADFLRHSTFHAYGLSRTAAVLAGIQRNLPLAHLASSQAHDALPAYLLAVQRISSSTAVDNGVQLGRGPPAVRPRPGWDNSAVTKDSTIVEHRNEQKEKEEEERRKEAMLAVPTYMALHNPVCSKCGIASLPGLTSSSSPRPPPAKKRRRGSTAKEKEVGTPSRPFVNNAKCLLCEGDVIPGHAASDPKLEQAEREAAIRSRARFGSVKKRERLRVPGGRTTSSGGGREDVSLDVGARTRRSLDVPSMTAAAAVREGIAVPIPTLVPIISQSPTPAPTPALAPLQAPAPAPPTSALAPFKAPAQAPKPAAAPNPSPSPSPSPSPFARPATLPPHPSRPTSKGKERKKDRAAALRDILGSRDKQQGGGGAKGGGRDKDSSGKNPPPSGSSGGGLADFLSLL